MHAPAGAHSEQTGGPVTYTPIQYFEGSIYQIGVAFQQVFLAMAPQAAGVIYSDFERGFIRAEVYSVDDLPAVCVQSVAVWTGEPGRTVAVGQPLSSHTGHA
jgi:ribosome-binding ATPase YchF (GTP1/OBG family)